ncbi:MAG: ArnT family glycosyltransferase [Acidimicrobiales bacterium]
MARLLRAAQSRLVSDRALLALVAVTVVGGVLRLAWVIVATRRPVGFHDPTFYLQYAEAIARGDGFVRPGGEPTAYYPVGYPALLAIPVALVVHTPIPDNLPAVASGLNVVAGTVGVALMGVLGRRLVGPAAGTAAAAVVAFYPNLILHTAAVLTETVFCAVFAGVLVVLLWHRPDELSPRRIALGGALLGVATLIRPIVLVLLPAFALAWWWWRRRETDRLGRRLAILAVTCVGVVVPWTLRNAFVMDTVTFIGTNTGDNLCIGNNPEATGGFMLPDFCFGDFQEIGDHHVEARRNRALTGRALDWAVGHLDQQPRLVFWRTFWTFAHDHDGLRAVQSYEEDQWVPSAWQTFLGTTSDGYYFAAMGLGLLGLVRLARRPDPRLRFVAVAAVALTVTVWPFFGDARFHIPVSFLLCVPAGAAITRVLDATSRRAAASASS